VSEIDADHPLFWKCIAKHFRTSAGRDAEFMDLVGNTRFKIDSKPAVSKLAQDNEATPYINYWLTQVMRYIDHHYDWQVDRVRTKALQNQRIRSNDDLFWDELRVLYAEASGYAAVF
jgi:hypothetical protein